MNRVIYGDALETLRELPDGLAQVCVTSPPYWGLRDYGVEGQLGLEATPEEYVGRLVEIMREVRRVLKADGTLWLNLGDSYATQGGAGRQGESGQRATRTFTAEGSSAKGVPSGLKPKDLCGMPWRAAFALQADGWWLRSDIIWAKPNPMPESVTDRPTRSHEYLFLLTPSARYYYDADAIREEITESSKKRYQAAIDNEEEFDPARHKNTEGVQSPMELLTRAATGVIARGARNKRSVWQIATKPFSGAHFATFPPALVEPCILAGSSAKEPERRVVLDPFAGSGTVGEVAMKHGRDYLLIELNREYEPLIQKRLGLFYEAADA